MMGVGRREGRSRWDDGWNKFEGGWRQVVREGEVWRGNDFQNRNHHRSISC